MSAIEVTQRQRSSVLTQRLIKCLIFKELIIKDKLHFVSKLSLVLQTQHSSCFLTKVLGVKCTTSSVSLKQPHFLVGFGYQFRAEELPVFYLLVLGIPPEENLL